MARNALTYYIKSEAEGGIVSIFRGDTGGVYQHADFHFWNITDMEEDEILIGPKVIVEWEE